jgi:putative addiction module killer protein
MIDRNLFELRLHFGPGYRVYFAKRGKVRVLLLAGGDKWSQPRDIALARSLRDGEGL